jgi:predicted small lipoprotein YifL
MKRAIVAFMVVAGMALMMAGCGQEAPAPKKEGAPAGTAHFMPPRGPAKGMPEKTEGGN